ncbi:Pentulose kinase [Atractiella rhizophila]|nr:Pentulose kinase [Atractiella rhizophila]
MSDRYFIGVDVGTGSARAVLVSSTGDILAESTQNTTTWRDEKDHNIFEQSTDEIWERISKACKEVMRTSKIPPENIKGIGFDATCSLAVCKLECGSPVSVTPGSWGSSSSQSEASGYTRNIILWADHRASEEAAIINGTKHPILKFVGGTVSIEMEIPKTLWLKRNMPKEIFDQLEFWDLPDWLTYKATGGNRSRSFCSLGCKCNFVGEKWGEKGTRGWNDEFFTKIGLEEFISKSYIPLGGSPVPAQEGHTPLLTLSAGQPVGKGLSENAAKDLGLLPGTVVSSALIDAYAGFVASLESIQGALNNSFKLLAAVAGTSTCHLIQNEKPIFVPGVWGPYRDAIFPGYWLNEGGQSSTGQLLDFMLTTHPAYNELLEIAKFEQTDIYKVLEGELGRLLQANEKASGRKSFLTELTKEYHIYPDLHGNRSPLADPSMRGMLIGISLDKGLSDLALRYFATCEAIAFQTRHIVEDMNAKGHNIEVICMSGGLVKNSYLMKLLADVIDVPIELPASSSSSVVLGSAMIAAMAAHPEELEKGEIKSQEQAEERGQAASDRNWKIIKEMSKKGTVIQPSLKGEDGKKEKKLLDVKYKIYKECIDIQRRWRKEVAEALA